MAEHEILQQAKRIRYDLTALQAKLTELIRMAALLPEPDQHARPRCPACGLTLKGPRTLAEHVHYVHGGPKPKHWREIEQLAAADPDPEPGVPRARVPDPTEADL